MWRSGKSRPHDDGPIAIERLLAPRYASSMQRVISSDPEVMGGTAVFAGTRVPIQTLLDYLRGGETIDDFLDGFPTVTREQVLALLDELQEKVVPVAS